MQSILNSTHAHAHAHTHLKSAFNHFLNDFIPTQTERSFYDTFSSDFFGFGVCAHITHIVTMVSSIGGYKS